MSPELTQAIKERIAIGHSQEQIAAELKTAGYDDATIAAVYHAATQSGAVQSGAVGTTQPALATNPGGRLIGPLALLQHGFAVAASQWKGFVLTALGLILATILFAVLFGVVGAFILSVSGGMIVTGLFMFITYVAYAALLVLFVGAMLRAVLYRAERASFGGHFNWMRTRAWSATKVALFQYFFVSNPLYIPAGLILYMYVAVFQGQTSIANMLTVGSIEGVNSLVILSAGAYVLTTLLMLLLTAYGGWALLLFVSGRASGVASVTASVLLVKGRVWPVFWRLLFLGLVATVYTFVGGAVLAAADISGEPAELLLVLLQLLLVPVLVSAGVLLFESLSATEQPVVAAVQPAIHRRVKLSIWTGAGAILAFITALFFVMYVFLFFFLAVLSAGL